MIMEKQPRFFLPETRQALSMLFRPAFDGFSLKSTSTVGGGKCDPNSNFLVKLSGLTSFPSKAETSIDWIHLISVFVQENETTP